MFRLQDLTEANNIIDVKSVKAGSVIFIPCANQVIDNIHVKTMNTAASIKTHKNSSVVVKDPEKSDEVKKEKMAIISEASVDADPAKSLFRLYPNQKLGSQKLRFVKKRRRYVTVPDKKNEPKSTAQMPVKEKK